MFDDGVIDSEADFINIPVDGLVVGLSFENENIAVNSVLEWSKKVYCPLVKSRRAKTAAESDGKSRGRRCFECPHGKGRPPSVTGVRPKQNVKFTKCPVSININEQEDGSFLIKKAVLTHSGKNFKIFC